MNTKFKENRNYIEPQGFPARKKQFGQHFLRLQSVVDNMINKVKITPETTVMEIGCGDGFLTSAILDQTKCKQLRAYEIDSEWADFVKNEIRDPRLDVFLENILDLDFTTIEQFQPLVLLANLPYQITFPIMFLLQKNKHLFQEGVVMVQEEVARKITARKGKGYSSTSLFLQYNFEFELLDKIKPSAFIPPPKVDSRLLYFKPKFDQVEIPKEQEFWKFLKLCFLSPRKTLHNNLRTTHYELARIPEEMQKLRAQQFNFDDLLKLWKEIIQLKN